MLKEFGPDWEGAEVPNTQELPADWWTDIDESIWEECGRPCAPELSELDELEQDDLIRWVSLYQGPPRKGLKGLHKQRADQQRRGRFSLWRREPDHWKDLRGEDRVGDEETDDLPFVAAGLMLSHGLHFTSPERLSLAEAEPLLERLRCCANPAQVLEVWLRRRACCLEPRERFQIALRARRQTPSLHKFLDSLQPPARPEGDALVFEVETLAHEHLDEHPLMQLAEGFGELEEFWVGSPPPRLQLRSGVDDLLLRVGEYLLRFPTSLSFQALHKALCCLYGVPQSSRDYEFKLSLDRVVTPDDDYEWLHTGLRLPETQRVGRLLHPGSSFYWNDIPLRVLGTTDEAGPSPWFPNGPLAANQRLRRTFHSRLGKIILEPRPKLPDSNSHPLPGLSQRNLSKLKPKEALVVCLLEAAGPLELSQVDNYLQLEGFPLPHGLETLKKAWRRDPIVAEDVQGRVRLVAGAVLLDSGLRESLSGLYDGEDELVARLEALFQLNREPDIWEKLYRAQGKPEVQIWMRNRPPLVCLKPWFYRNGTPPYHLLFKSQNGWESICVDEVQDVTG